MKETVCLTFIDNGVDFDKINKTISVNEEVDFDKTMLTR